MRTALLILGAALLLAALLFVTSHSAKSPTAEIHAEGQTGSTPKAPEQLSADLSGQEPRVPAPTPGIEAASAAEVAAEPEMHPENNLLPLRDMTEEPGSHAIDPSRPIGSEFFEGKYTGRTAKQRLQAIDRLHAIVEAHENGSGSEPLTEEQIQAMRIEIDWLKSNRGS